MPKMIYKFNAVSIKTQTSFHFSFGITRLQTDTAILNRKKKAEVITGSGEKPVLKSFTALAEDWSLVANTHVKQHIMTPNSSFRVYQALFRALQVLAFTCTHPTQIHNLKN